MNTVFAVNSKQRVQFTLLLSNKVAERKVFGQRGDTCFSILTQQAGKFAEAQVAAEQAMAFVLRSDSEFFRASILVSTGQGKQAVFAEFETITHTG